MIFGDSAQIHHFGEFHGSMLVDLSQHHLFLVAGIESVLTKIGCFPAGMPVHFGAQRVRAAPTGAMRFQQTGLYQFFDGSAGRMLGLLRKPWDQVFILHTLPKSVKNERADPSAPS